MSQEVHFKVLEEDNFSNDVVGEGTCTLADLCQASTDQSYEISFEGKSAGTIRLATTFVNFHDAKAEEAERLRIEAESEAAIEAARLEAEE